jgi:DNA-binding transcriptional ArsR family regulator
MDRPRRNPYGTPETTKGALVTTATHPTRAAEDGGQDKVLAALATLGQATANEIADQAGLGYSTVTARLRKLAEAGTVHKQPSGTGPTSWCLADAAAEPDNQSELENRSELENQPESEDQPEEAEPIVNEVDEAEPDEAEHDLAAPTEVEPGTDRDTASQAPPSAVDATGEDAISDATLKEPTTKPAGPDPKPTGGTPGTRRPPGKLREQVLGVLQDHAGGTLTPHQISKLLGGASSGAIVLACRKLVGEGSAKQVRERPATFQAE